MIYLPQICVNVLIEHSLSSVLCCPLSAVCDVPSLFTVETALGRPSVQTVFPIHPFLWTVRTLDSILWGSDHKELSTWYTAQKCHKYCASIQSHTWWWWLWSRSFKIYKKLKQFYCFSSKIFWHKIWIKFMFWIKISVTLSERVSKKARSVMFCTFSSNKRILWFTSSLHPSHTIIGYLGNGERQMVRVKV